MSITVPKMPVKINLPKGMEPEHNNGDDSVKNGLENSEEIEKNMECCVEQTLNTHNIGNMNENSEDRLLIRKSIVDHISSNDQVFFKSLKEDEVELSKKEKTEIAEELLDRNYGLFLAKFGNHLLKEHLCYFENRSEEESVIVDLHLSQLNKVFERKTATKKSSIKIEKSETPPAEEMEVVVELSPPEKSRLNLRNRLLDHLSLSTNAHFKSQQVGEPDLNQEEKREIAKDILDRSASLFLSRFGTHLLEEHLDYFDSGISPEESYEVSYHLKQLRKTHCKPVSKVEIKNRRFEALKKMVDEGSYFCETEMRNRNPLLYEQLVGRFLTPEERKERLDNIDTTNITFVNLLLEQMDREKVKKLRKEQEDEEYFAMEEKEENEVEMETDDSDSEDDNHLDKTLWGEQFTDGEPSTSKRAPLKHSMKRNKNTNEDGDEEISDAEKKMLLDEFRSNMFSSFLQGKDVDFDYSQVDDNSDYDDLEARGQDEEEKYFNEESPQDTASNKMSDDEDLLDQYMYNLKPEPTTQQLTAKMSSLSHEEV